MLTLTVGHGRRPLAELVAVLREAGAETLVDVRQFPGSRRNPQFNQGPVAEALEQAGIAYVHAAELGRRRSGEPGEDWQESLAHALQERAPAFMCAETPWQRCHRRFIADLLTARGHEVVHLIRPGEREPHRLSAYAEARDGRLYLCGVEAA